MDTIRVVKREQHSVEFRYSININEMVIRSVYPNLSDDEVSKLMTDAENGSMDYETFVSDCYADDGEGGWKKMAGTIDDDVIRSTLYEIEFIESDPFFENLYDTITGQKP